MAHDHDAGKNSLYVRADANLDRAVSVALRWGFDMGSLLSMDQAHRVAEHVEDARAKGARVLTSSAGHRSPTAARRGSSTPTSA
ncbi:hypothetical protein V3N99_05450 [Dermatophilaceae bacterium Soc4.6]